MKLSFSLIVCIQLVHLVAVSVSFKPNKWRRVVNHSSNDLQSGLVCLNAKKKSKLISDDFLSSIDLDDQAQTEDKTTKISPNLDLKKVDKKLSKLGISDDLLMSLSDVSESTMEVENGKSKKKKKDKGKSKGKSDGSDESSEQDSSEEFVTSTHDAVTEASSSEEQDNSDGGSIEGTETIEERVRKERPPARVRFAESSQPDYVMMALEKVELMYGNKVVLKDASFSVTTGERVGLVGPNGGGKTTQLRILAGEIEPTTGDVVKSSRNLRVSYLRQEFTEGLGMDRTLREELNTAFIEEKKLLEDIAALEEQVGLVVDDTDKMTEILDKLQGLQDKAISKGVYALDSKVEKIMDTMGFSSGDADALVKSFSGGWKMRIGLAKILLQDPNILLLDEPTNHLDLDSVFWLEDFLVKQNIPMVIVSHDREFLDRVCNKIVDVEEGVCVSYNGNYSKFLEQKTARLDQWRDQYEKQMRYVKEEEKWIKKARSDPSMAQQLKAKEMALEKFMAAEDFVKSPPKDKKFRFRFPPAPRCGQSVVETSKLTHGYGTGKYSTLFQNVDIQVDRGERIGFVGPNGAGKSTLLRLVMGTETPKGGYAEFGSTTVQPAYFAQSQADTLDLEKTVLETVQEVAPEDFSFTEVRTLLGQFMFKSDDVDKKLNVLSGGEKARVALCRMMLKPSNLLLLDEPTNHLDITAKEVLEEALQHFEGSVLIVSHDRYFMSQVANRIFAFENKGVTRHDCDYHDFIHGRSDGLKERIESRAVEGDRYRITNAKEPIIVEEQAKSKKNFGGSGVTSGNLNKGIKNAKRFTN